MRFKLHWFFIILTLSNIVVAFPQLNIEDIKRQEILTDQINQNPTNADLRFELAMQYASTGWIELAWDQLKLIPRLQKDYENVVFNRYSALIEQNPTDWTAHFRLAFAHYFKNDKDNAIASFQNVLKINPNHVWSMGLIALIYGEQKKYDLCIDWSVKALNINDNATAIHFLLGQAYYETGNYFGVIGETLSVGRLKSIESKYRPVPPIGVLE
tara:strand:- start:6 stop:644 length:639 start_codon:yes stop_codon:yes gene_type:complete